MENPVIQEMKKQIHEAGSQFHWALTNDLSPSYVSDILSGRRQVSSLVAKKLGFKVTISYEKIN